MGVGRAGRRVREGPPAPPRAQHLRLPARRRPPPPGPQSGGPAARGSKSRGATAGPAPPGARQRRAAGPRSRRPLCGAPAAPARARARSGSARRPSVAGAPATWPPRRPSTLRVSSGRGCAPGPGAGDGCQRAQPPRRCPRPGPAPPRVRTVPPWRPPPQGSCLRGPGLRPRGAGRGKVWNGDPAGWPPSPGRPAGPLAPARPAAVCPGPSCARPSTKRPRPVQSHPRPCGSSGSVRRSVTRSERARGREEVPVHGEGAAVWSGFGGVLRGLANRPPREEDCLQGAETRRGRLGRLLRSLGCCAEAAGVPAQSAGTLGGRPQGAPGVAGAGRFRWGGGHPAPLKSKTCPRRARREGPLPSEVLREGVRTLHAFALDPGGREGVTTGAGPRGRAAGGGVTCRWPCSEHAQTQ